MILNPGHYSLGKKLTFLMPNKHKGATTQQPHTTPDALNTCIGGSPHLSLRS